ncbi:homoserine dehydrogenase [Raphidocelis subcapitata]|uniref:Homoserine dehydrogenase n=1 Tax=Raphidocelis subcapitata TaxID=307507 RepID=A0A2V0PQD8_9CHLO|nr:homoserine dehydrogenase [Raphidocelis subcapitata]|eukprot:GBG00404.1 homoserine dehydrogenase [Raphidocelis subcapitata]
MRALCIGLVGPGLIGKALVLQLDQQAAYLATQMGLRVALVAVANSRRQLLAPAGAPLQGAQDWQERLQAAGDPVSLPALASHVAAQRGPGGVGVIVDCTASDEVPDHYAAWLRAGLHVVTPNKKWGAGPLPRHAAALAAAREGRARLLAEASVGAGLPVLGPLRDLVETGDAVTRIEGILSGTLSYIFNTWAPGQAFSSVVGAAKELGYTEPDPREDLSGMDVARKVVILARGCGLKTELSDLKVESLVPAPLREGSAEDFMRRLPEFDAEMGARAEAAAAGGGVLRYVGAVDAAAGTASVTLQTFPAAHPFAQLRGSDNVVSFATRRYAATPLIVRGPGAGAEVTAAGVFGDVLCIARGAAE